MYIQDYKRPLERLGTVCMEAEAAGSTVASRRSARGAREHGGRVAQCAVVNGARFLRPFEVAYVKAAFTVKDKRKKKIVALVLIRPLQCKIFFFSSAFFCSVDITITVKKR